MSTYRVTATRDGNWWSLVAHDVHGREVASPSRRLDQADAAIREAIALVIDVDVDDFEVDVSPDPRQVEVSDETLEALELRRALAELSDRARRRTPAAIAGSRLLGSRSAMSRNCWRHALAGLPDREAGAPGKLGPTPGSSTSWPGLLIR